MRILRRDTPKEKKLTFQLEGNKQQASHTWFRGDHCNYNPSVANLTGSNAVLDYVVKGWAPPRPMIGPDTKVVAFGSCFAANITRWLSERKYSVLTDQEGEGSDAYVVRFGEGMVNTFVIRQQFEWAFENKVVEAELWHGYDAQSFGYDEQVRRKTLDIFSAADVFVITLGLSEVWYDEKTGGVFWRAVPADKYDPERHKFRVTSVAENKENIHAIYQLIRKHRPEAKVIFTLSPIPLVATFRPVSCMTANSVSKAVLRSALDETLREIDEPDCAFYWPSYEIVLDVFADRWKDDRRHVKPAILDFIMTLFEHVWCHGSEPTMSLPEAWLIAQSASGTLPPMLKDAFRKDDARAVAAAHARIKKRDKQDNAELIREAARAAGARNPASKIGLWAENHSDAGTAMSVGSAISSLRRMLRK